MENIHQIGVLIANSPSFGFKSLFPECSTFWALSNFCARPRLLLSLHDEIIVECRNEEKERVKFILKREMESAMKLSVPLAVVVKTGPSWGDLDE